MTRLKFTDEGKVYNHLKIIRQAQARVNKAGNKESRVDAECLLCGTVKNLSWTKVKSGHTKTCGCARLGHRKDIAGERFGILTAVRCLDTIKSGSVLWECVCDCGRVKNYTVSDLGAMKSCGCMQYRGTPLDLSEQVFGRLTAKEPVGKNKAGQYIWKCLCSCGEDHVVAGTQLVEGGSKSCGCLAKEVRGKASLTHGWANTPEYGAWKNAISRCTNPHNRKYGDYGGRGITVCSRWTETTPQGFLNFLEDMGERPAETSLDRVDVNEGYCKENCRWVDACTQAYNTRMSQNNTSGRTGVSQMKSGKWQAYITHTNVRTALGVFNTLEEAVSARENAELKIHGEVKE